METKTKTETEIIETSYDDLKLKYLTLKKCREPVDVSEANNLGLLINIKQDLIQDLTEAIETETRLTLEYNHKYNKLLLTTDFKEELQEARPTGAMKESWLVEKLHELYDAKIIAEKNTKLIRKHLDLLEDRIKLERTIIQLRQIE